MRTETQGRYLQSVLEKAKELPSQTSKAMVTTDKFEHNSYQNALPMISHPRANFEGEDKGALAYDLCSIYPEPYQDQSCPSFLWSQDLSWVRKKSKLDNVENQDLPMVRDGVFVNESLGINEEDGRRIVCANSKVEFGWEQYNSYESLPNSIW